MADLVVTVPRELWRDWIAEGDAAGEPDTGQEYYWRTGRGNPGPIRPPIEVGERLYIVAYDRLRGYAPVTDVRLVDGAWWICRRGGAVAITIDTHIRGFQAWRYVWWRREDERPFLDWRSAGVAP